MDAKAIFTALNTTFGVGMCPFPFAAIAHEALDMDWTQDPFDRLIVAHATVDHEARLITRDRLIRRHYGNAVW